jgi:hypothetical protein
MDFILVDTGGAMQPVLRYEDLSYAKLKRIMWNILSFMKWTSENHQTLLYSTNLTSSLTHQLRKQMNISDQANDQLQKFWRVRSQIAYAELSQKDKKALAKILGRMVAAEQQISLILTERQRAVKLWGSSQSETDNKTD